MEEHYEGTEDFSGHITFSASDESRFSIKGMLKTIVFFFLFVLPLKEPAICTSGWRERVEDSLY